MCAPTLSDVTRSIAILEHWKDNWLEKQWLGCSIDRWLENKTWEDVLAWVDENESQHNSDCGFFIRYCLDIGLDKYGRGVGNYIATGTYFEPSLYENPTIDGRNAALIGRSGIYAGGQWSEFDQAQVREDVTHSFYEGTGAAAPVRRRDHTRSTPRRAASRASTAGPSRRATTCRASGNVPLEVGPLARRMAAGGPNAAGAPGRRPAVRRHLQQDRAQRVRASAGPHARGAEVLQVGARLARSARPQGELLHQADRARRGHGLRLHRGRPRRRCRTGSSSRTTRSRTTRSSRRRRGTSARATAIEVLGPIETGAGRLADRGPRGPGRTRTRGPQLRLLPGVHRARLRRQDRAASCRSSSSTEWCDPYVNYVRRDRTTRHGRPHT